MKRPKQSAPALPQFDYGQSLQTAVSWLGDKHLLARPVARRKVERPTYFVENPRNRKH